MIALVIDDSKATRALIEQILGDIGFEVTHAGHGRHALESLKRIGKVDVALVDWNMPEMNGLEFVQAVRADPAYDDMPLMMVTTETEKHQIERALEAGANEYVMKPFTKEVMQEKLDILGLLDCDTCRLSAS